MFSAKLREDEKKTGESRTKATYLYKYVRRRAHTYVHITRAKACVEDTCGHKKTNYVKIHKLAEIHRAVYLFLTSYTET